MIKYIAFNGGIDMKMLNNKVDLSNLNLSEKKEYFEMLKKQCLAIKSNQLSIGQGLISNIYPILRSYKLEIQGEENIPSDSNVLFVANHSNSHDIFTAYEMFSMLERHGSVMVATDCLSPIATQLFRISNATLLDRRVKEDRSQAVLNLSNKILNGFDGLIFGEGTWNLHPYKTMQNIQNGAGKISLITQVPIIPTIIEYIEKEELVSSDSQLFSKCIIRFGKPIMINLSDPLSLQSSIIKKEMCRIREQIWSDYNIKKGNVEIVDPQMYLNHTYAKKFKAFGFTFNSEAEQEFLYFKDDELKENEYTLDENGILKPGITIKNKLIKTK